MILYKIIAIIGLISIILGTMMISSRKKIKKRDTYYLLIIGGICLEVYSIYTNDLIFIILEGILIISPTYELIKLYKR